MRDGRRRRSAHFRFQSGPVTSLACAPAWRGQWWSAATRGSQVAGCRARAMTDRSCSVP